MTVAKQTVQTALQRAGGVLSAFGQLLPFIGSQVLDGKGADHIKGAVRSYMELQGNPPPDVERAAPVVDYLVDYVLACATLPPIEPAAG